MISFSFLSKRPGATVAGVFSVALGSVLLLCGAGSAPIENLLPQGAMQGDLNAGGHNLTNAATVSAAAFQVTGLTSQATVGTDSSGNLVAGSGGGSLTLGSNATGAGFTYSAGTLSLTHAVNRAGGLARLVSSDGTADGTIAFGAASFTDDGYNSIAIGSSAYSIYGGVSYGINSMASYGGCAIGNTANAALGGGGCALGSATTTNSGAAIGAQAWATTGVAAGYDAAETAGGSAMGLGAHATSGVAAGLRQSDLSSTTETGGGANFCGGSYAGAGIAINADEIAVSNGSGFATLTGCINSSSPASSSAAGTAGQFAYDSNFLYVCVAANTWKRAALSSW